MTNEVFIAQQNTTIATGGIYWIKGKLAFWNGQCSMKTTSGVNNTMSWRLNTFPNNYKNLNSSYGATIQFANNAGQDISGYPWGNSNDIAPDIHFYIYREKPITTNMDMIECSVSFAFILY